MTHAKFGRAALDFIAARDRLIEFRENYGEAFRGFRWPQLDEFNWACDYFDVLAASSSRVALRVVDDTGLIIR